jgi:hypothetical protein
MTAEEGKGEDPSKTIVKEGKGFPNIVPSSLCSLRNLFKDSFEHD